jgi:RHS repeat-associated protein
MRQFLSRRGRMRASRGTGNDMASWTIEGPRGARPALRKLVLVLLRLVCLAATGTGTMAAAQDVPQVISPLRIESDHNGVNLIDGKMSIDPPTLSIPAAPHLRFDRAQNAAPYINGKITNANVQFDQPGSATYSVHTGEGSSEAFRCVDSDCYNVGGTGSTLVTYQAFHQAGTGGVWHFTLKHDNVVGANNTTLLYYASSVDYPNGEAISYTYQTYVMPGDTFNRTFYRPTTITSNLGYAISLTYQSDDFNSDYWGTVAQATLYALSDPATPLGRLTYSGSTITDLGGRVFTCTNCANMLGAETEVTSGSVQFPGEASPALQVTASPTAGVVSTVTRDGVPWTYSYTNLRFSGTSYLYDRVTVDGPNGFHNVYDMTVEDNQNVITRITDSIGRATAVTSDGFRPIRVVAPELNEVDVVYDDYANIISKTTKAKPGSGLPDLVETASYPTASCVHVLCYRPTWIRDALGRQTDFVYNSAGQVTEQTDPADAGGVRRKTYITYTATSPSRKSVVRVCGDITTCGTANEIRTEYDYWGSTYLPSAERHIDAAAGVTLTTTYSYDNAGRPLVVDGPLAGTDDATYYRYDVFGRKTWEIGPKGANGLRDAKRFTYRDNDDKVVATEMGTVADPANPVLTILQRADVSYDGRRNPIREVVTASSTTWGVTERSFDNRGQLVCEARRMNPAAFGTVTDGCTLGTQGSFGPDRITHNHYDAAGQLDYIDRAYLTPLAQTYARYEYTPNGKQKAVIDANGNRAEMTWDGYDRQKRWIFPSPSGGGAANQGDYEEYDYDKVGNRTLLRKRDNAKIIYSYDGMNRMTTKVVDPSATGAPGYSVFYGYDVRGLQTYARFGSATGPGVSNVFDAFGRLASSTTTMDGVSRTMSSQYDSHGNKTYLAGAFGYNAAFSYDAADHFTAYPGLVSVAYDASGRRSSLGMGPGSTTSSVTYGYDGIDRLASLTHDLAGTAADQTLSFGYNPASQIVSRMASNDGYASNTAYNVSRGYSVNGLNQYTAAGPAAFTYDGNGNLTWDGSTSYVYDAENRLVSASGGHSVNLAYDPLGRLWQTSVAGAQVTRFLYDGDRLVMEYDAAGNCNAYYVHGPGADEPLVWYTTTERRFLHADHQGSIVSIADDSGNIIRVNGYDPWGIPNAGNIGRFQYTGQAWIPELGMYYYKARIYSPTLGRFMQTDPVGYKDQVDLYAYVGNDPIDGRDPTGLATIEKINDHTYHVTFYYKMKENGAKFEFSGKALKTYIEKSVQGSTTYEGREVAVTSSMVIVPSEDSTTGGSDTHTIFQDSKSTHDTSKRPGSYSDGPGGNIHLQEHENVAVAAHEVPHPAGAGDQRAGGVDAQQHPIPLTAGPFQDTLMNNGRQSVNSQTLREILECKCNTWKP